MRALSIRQPWAWAICYAGKTIENRDWYCSYRGPILIHASKLPERKSAPFDFVETMADIRAAEALSKHANTWPADLHLSYRVFQETLSGGIVGSAEIVNCLVPGAGTTSPWYTGAYGLVLANVRPISLVRCKGALGLWTVGEDTERLVREAMAYALRESAGERG